MTQLREPGPTAILLIGHGSRREEANEELFQLARQLQLRGAYPIVQAAFLELAVPTIPDGGLACVNAGASHVILLPYFLSMGKHVVEDLGAARNELSQQFPGVLFSLADPLGKNPLLLDALEEQARHANSRTSGLH